MDPSSLIVDDASHPGVRVLTLNRLGKANALDENLYQLINQAFSEIKTSSHIRSVVIQSASRKIFCAGADVNAFADCPPIEAQKKRRQQLVVTLGLILECEKPVVAALEGKVIGAGAMLALCADVIVATDSVTWSFPEIHLGMPSPIGIAILKKRATYHHIHRLILRGEILQASELREAHLIDHLSDSDHLRPESIQCAERALNAKAFSINKRWFNRSTLAEIKDAQNHLDQLAT